MAKIIYLGLPAVVLGSLLAFAKPNISLETKATQDNRRVEFIQNIQEKEPLELNINSQDAQETNQPLNEQMQNPLERIAATEAIVSPREIDALALTIYGEARGEVFNGNNDYVYGVARSAITRAGLRGESIDSIVLAAKRNKRGVLVNQYTCFSRDDTNYNELNSPDKAVLARCREIAENILKERVEGSPELKKVTNYYVGKEAVPGKYKTLAEAKADKIPAWAFVNNSGNFAKDKRGYLIPRKTVAAADVRQTKCNGDRAFFYYSKHF